MLKMSRKYRLWDAERVLVKTLEANEGIKEAEE